jgi:predicted lysophospholipase L1 biosynthesis ABC-type transport system permease subunit
MRFGADTSPCAEVVGVVQNVRRQSLFEDSTGSGYFPLAQDHRLGYRRMIVRPASDQPARVIEAVRTASQTAAPQHPNANVYVASDDPVVRRELRPSRLGAAMFGPFGVLALVLAAVGIYAVVSYDVGQRTREMGVRLALGAKASDVGRLVVRDGVSVIALGALIGIGVVLIGAKFVAPLLYQISPRDPLVLAGVSASMIVVAAAACVIPAWRAMRVDAAVALRSE